MRVKFRKNSKMTKNLLIRRGFCPRKVESYCIYKECFEYCVQGKYTMKFFDGNVIFDNADGCLYNKGLITYKKDNKMYRLNLIKISGNI